MVQIKLCALGRRSSFAADEFDRAVTRRARELGYRSVALPSSGTGWVAIVISEFVAIFLPSV
jgi:hypothetical protein